MLICQRENVRAYNSENPNYYVNYCEEYGISEAALIHLCSQIHPKIYMNNNIPSEEKYRNTEGEGSSLYNADFLAWDSGGGIPIGGGATAFVFDSEVWLPDDWEDIQYAFCGLPYFNHYFHVPFYAVNCSYLFWNCPNFSQNVYIPDSVDNCSHMFYECSNYNAYVGFGDNVAANCTTMFGDCVNYNPRETLYIPDRVGEDCVGLLAGCNNFQGFVSVPNMFYEQDGETRNYDKLGIPYYNYSFPTQHICNTKNAIADYRDKDEQWQIQYEDNKPKKAHWVNITDE